MFEEANLWDKNIHKYLLEIYQKKAYNEKLWTNHERVSMQTRAFQESREYILPTRSNNTEIPGILNTVGYIVYEIKHQINLLILPKNSKGADVFK